jgi:hypothetical protein
MADSRDPMRWLWRGVALAVLVLGWIFIAWQNHFHISAPVVFICLGFLAVILTVANLWRTGVAAVAEPGEGDDSTWAKPAGALGELQREKRTLLKAIKEAEFDHQMGKLSQVDVDAMVRTYRARAIEVIKEIERLETGTAGTARDQIMREVRARLELEGKAKPKKAAKDAKPVAASDAGPVAAPEAGPADEALSPVEAAERRHAEGTAARPAAEADEDLDADSTTALDADSTTTREPPRARPAKEATP